MLLNTRKVFYEESSHTTILVAIEDITARRAKERELDELLQQKELLLQEMRHRCCKRSSMHFPVTGATAL